MLSTVTWEQAVCDEKSTEPPHLPRPATGVGGERAPCWAVGAGAVGARPPARAWRSPVACSQASFPPNREADSGQSPHPPQLLIVLVFLKVHSTRHSMKSLFHVRYIWQTLNLGPVSPANPRIAYEWACRSEQRGRPGLFSCVCPVPACPWQGWRLHADCIFWEGHTRALRVSPPSEVLSLGCAGPALQDGTGAKVPGRSTAPTSHSVSHCPHTRAPYPVRGGGSGQAPSSCG